MFEPKKLEDVRRTDWAVKRDAERERRQQDRS